MSYRKAGQGMLVAFSEKERWSALDDTSSGREGQDDCHQIDRS